MKKQLLKNWPLKLISLLAAVGIWMMVIYITDPTITKTFSVPIEMVNEDIVGERGRSVTVVGDPYVNVRVSKSRSIVNALTESDFKAVADFSKMYEDAQVPVSVTSTNARLQSSDYTQEKFSLEVKMEDLQTVTIPIEYTLSGQPASGFAIGDVKLSPSTVTVTAPESYASLVKTAMVTIDVADVSEDFTKTAALRIYDGNGTWLKPEENKDTTISTKGKIKCSVKLFLIKKVPIIVEPKGTDRVADGYEYVGATVDPDTVTISGTKAVIGQVSSIVINDISAAGLSDSRTIEVDLMRFLPDNVTIVDENTRASVTLMCEPYVERTFSISRDRIDVINVPAGLEYRILSTNVNLTLRALEADLNSLDEESIVLTLDLKGYHAGNMNIKLSVVLPSDVYQQKGNCTANVRLTRIEETPEETVGDN